MLGQHSSIHAHSIACLVYDRAASFMDVPKDVQSTARKVRALHTPSESRAARVNPFPRQVAGIMRGCMRKKDLRRRWDLCMYGLGLLRAFILECSGCVLWHGLHVPKRTVAISCCRLETEGKRINRSQGIHRLPKYAHMPW